MRKKLLSMIAASLIAVGSFGVVDAASRAEIAAIRVEKPSDFKYWNDTSPIKKKIIEYVEDVTNPKSANYIPPEDRIVVTDMDGTFYCETAPTYFQEMMFIHRVLEDGTYAAPKHLYDLALKIKPKFYAKEKLTPEEDKAHLDAVSEAYAGMTVEEYQAYVRKFMETNEVGLTNLKRGEAFYLPMIELYSYLSNNGFKVYIDTACNYFITRELVNGITPIPSDRILATRFDFTSTGLGEETSSTHFWDRHKEKVVFAGTPFIENGKTEKIFSLINHIGKKPVLSFGNSGGDSGMFEYTLHDNKYRSMSFMVICDDTERELGNAKRAVSDKEFAEKRGWDTISMRNDWKTIYGYNVKKA